MKNYDENLKELWKNKYKMLIFIISFILFSIVLYINTTKQDNKDLKEFRRRYKHIARFDTFAGCVQEIQCFKGASVITLTNGDEFLLSNSRNYDYEIFEMCCFINLGDSIYKKPNNDSIFISRVSDKYYFVLGEFIGEKYDSKFYNNPCR